MLEVAVAVAAVVVAVVGMAAVCGWWVQMSSAEACRPLKVAGILCPFVLLPPRLLKSPLLPLPLPPP